jgi:class 3 adenylate cyclase/pimeloyl-ACP methyl ester carboxylesterase
VDPAPTLYLDRDGSALAYQVVGSGPSDTIWHLDTVQHLDLSWADPHSHHNFERQAAFGRGAIFQRRGVGLSEPIGYVPTLEQQADDVLAIADACAMPRPVLIGVFSACAAVAMAAARAPERVGGLILVLPFATVPRADLVPTGWEPADAADYCRTRDEVLERWGSGLSVALWDVAADTAYNRRLMGLLERSSMTPASARAHVDWYTSLDLTGVFRSLSVPVRVLRQATSRSPGAAVRHVADLIDGAEYVELPPVPRGASLGESIAAVVDHARAVATGTDAVVPQRSFGTVLFTDIVGSTQLLARLGDERYGELRDEHERAVRLSVDDHGGRLLKTLGDGTLSLFDGPVAAISCADELRREATALGVEIRAGIHTGELQRSGGDVAGMTVHVGARIAGLAGAREILVSTAVRDVSAGAGISFRPAGSHELRGVPGRWELFEIVEMGHPSMAEIGDPLVLSRSDAVTLAAARRNPRALRAITRAIGSVRGARSRR